MNIYTQIVHPQQLMEIKTPKLNGMPQQFVQFEKHAPMEPKRIFQFTKKFKQNRFQGFPKIKGFHFGKH